jgi:phosphopentomutase
MKAIIVVLDGLGIGAQEDSHLFNDPKTCNTLVNSLKKYLQNNKIYNFYNLSKLGFRKIIEFKDKINAKELGFIDINVISSYGILTEKSNGKDTITGHWELAGIISNKGFPTFKNGFPSDLINEFEKRINRKILGNKVASGTEIIKELGDLHLKTGYPIVYTSADSVFQIAAHIDVINLDELYSICEIAFDLLKNYKNGIYLTSRVIARPFAGSSGNYYRLNDKRKDFAVLPPKTTLLDIFYESNLEVVAIGKVVDIFANKSITKSYKVSGNLNILNKTIEVVNQDFNGLVFSNLVDFDTLYGHRQDYIGMVNALIEFDQNIMNLVNEIKEDDILFIVADHGNDPTDDSTDHTREHTPLIVYSKNKNFRNNFNLGFRDSFSDVAKTIFDYFKNYLNSESRSLIDGNSFLDLIFSDLKK